MIDEVGKDARKLIFFPLLGEIYANNNPYRNFTQFLDIKV